MLILKVNESQSRNIQLSRIQGVESLLSLVKEVFDVLRDYKYASLCALQFLMFNLKTFKANKLFLYIKP